MSYIYIIANVCTFRRGARWCSGLARWQQWLCYLRGPGFESHLRPVEFFVCNKVSPLNSNTKICAMRFNYLTQGYQGLHVKKAKQVICLCISNERTQQSCVNLNLLSLTKYQQATLSINHYV